VAGDGAGFSFSFVIQCGTNGDAIEVYAAGVSAVTWETLASQRPADQVITTSSAYYGPCIDYDPNTLAVKGLEIEEARTNVLIQSNGFATAPWGSAGHVTTGSAAATSPDGTTNAWLLTHDGTAAQSLFQASTLGAGTYTETFYAKRGNNDWVFIELYNPTDGDMVAWFNLANGTVGTQTKSTGAIQNIGGGWYRLSITVAPTVANSSLVAPTTVSANGSFTRVAASTVYVFGGQVEAGAYATSYIPTAAASVTRAADVVQFIGPALTAIQGASFSAIVEAQTSSVPTTSRMLLGANAAVAFMYAPSVDNQTTFYDGTSGVATAGAGGGKLWSTIARSGISISGSSASLVMTGGGVVTGTHVLPARTTAYLGSYSLGEYVNGWVRSFAIYNQRLADGTLQSKSVVGAPY